MINVQVSIGGILMYCDDSIAGLNLGNGYSIEKVYFDDLPFKNRIVNGDGNLDSAYMGSRLYDDNGCYFMCVKKDDVYQINGPQFGGTTKLLTAKGLMCDEELSSYMDAESKYLDERINLCRVFKNGNIGFRDIFFENKFQPGIMSNTSTQITHIETRNIADQRVYHLSNNEVIAVNQWLADYSGQVYSLMHQCIEEFSWGLEQLDIPTGFEQFTTTLEMTLLPINQPGKKQMLANRVAAMLGTDATSIQRLHSKMLSFYRYRSESLHEGDGSNITELELRELEDLVRDVLKNILIRCKMDIATNPNISWTQVRDSLMQYLVNKVTNLKQSGALPT